MTSIDDDAVKFRLKLVKARLRAIDLARDIFEVVLREESRDAAREKLRLAPFSFSDLEANFLLDRPLTDYSPSFALVLRNEMDALARQLGEE